MFLLGQAGVEAVMTIRTSVLVRNRAGEVSLERARQPGSSRARWFEWSSQLRHQLGRVGTLRLPVAVHTRGLKSSAEGAVASWCRSGGEVAPPRNSW